MSAVKHLAALMDACGIPGLFCGGSARDTLLGRAPKDYDFVVYGDMEFADARSKLDGSLFVVKHVYPKAYLPTQRFNWAITVTFGYIDVDIIGWNTYPETPEDVVSNFDFDINACYFNEDHEAVALYPEALKPGHLVQPLYRADLRMTRTEYLAQKFPQFNWSLALQVTKEKDPTL